MANQHTSELVGVERAWAEAVAAGLAGEVRKALAPHTSKARLRSITAWLERGAHYDYASQPTIHHWRGVLVAAGDPPKPKKRREPPIMYLETRATRAA
ncbi:MAG: hypothetical protein ACRDOE_00135 [Streptosporangiaceae bacterium]